MIQKPKDNNNNNSGQKQQQRSSQVKGSDFSVSVCQSVNLRSPVCAVVFASVAVSVAVADVAAVSA